MDILLNCFIKAKKLEGCSDKSLLRYKYLIENFLKSENVHTEEVGMCHIHNFIQKKCDSEMKDSSIVMLIETLKVYFRWLERNKIITVPINNLKMNIKRTVTFSF